MSVECWVLPFNKFELPYLEEDNCCSWKVHIPTESRSSGGIRHLIISSVDLSNVTRISIHWNMLCSQNMLFTFSSFVNSTQVNDTLPSSSVGRLYRMYSTILVSLGLTPWLNSFNWSLRHLKVTPRTNVGVLLLSKFEFISFRGKIIVVVGRYISECNVM